jgi:hypothetical protein
MMIDTMPRNKTGRGQRHGFNEKPFSKLVVATSQGVIAKLSNRELERPRGKMFEGWWPVTIRASGLSF